MMMPSNRHGALAVSVLALAVVAAAPALAGEPRTHDGFFLRLSAGGGYGQTKVTVFDEDLKLSGAAGDINLAIGGAVTPNLAVHGTLWGWAVSSPDVELGSASGTASDATLNMSSYGAGITYYFVPANVYISPSLGLSILSIEEGGESARTDTGFGFDATIGKEWWVSDGWGLGVAGAFTYHSVPDGDIDERWSGPGFAVRFSATYN